MIGGLFGSGADARKAAESHTHTTAKKRKGTKIPADALRKGKCSECGKKLKNGYTTIQITHKHEIKDYADGGTSSTGCSLDIKTCDQPKCVIAAVVNIYLKEE